MHPFSPYAHLIDRAGGLLRGEFFLSSIPVFVEIPPGMG
jgi:hypothetical protein